MIVLGKLLLGTVYRAFTKKNGAVIATTTKQGTWDLEAVLAWFLRGIVVLALLYLAKKLGIDEALLLEHLSTQ